MNKIEHRINVFLSAHKTFGNIIKELLESQEVQDYSKLYAQLEKILSLHHQVYSDCRPFITEYQSLHHKLSEATREEGEIVCSRSSVKLDRSLVGAQESLQKYFLMKDTGATPEEVYRTAITDGINSYIDLLFLIRKVFCFSFEKAKNAIFAGKQSRD